MSDFRADLHCHSNRSDGTESPEELVDHALRIGLKGLSITDHDCVDAYETALDYAKEKGLKMLVGVEFSTMHRGNSVHILGYGFDWKHPRIVELVERHRKRRKERNAAIVEKLRSAGMEIEATGPGRPHIAEEMVRKGYVGTIDEAFIRWIGDGKPCYARGEGVETVESIEALHEAGGVAIIAHPHLLKDEKVIVALLKLPFDGIECYYGRFLPHQEERWVKIAKERGWIATGGSDYHGSVKPEVKLGTSWVGEETFRKLAG